MLVLKVNSECLSVICSAICRNEDFNFEEIKIFVGMDTRPSSLDFKNSLLSIFSILRINIIDLGLVTTPQLHFAVLHSNTVSSDLTKESKFYLDNYYNQFSSAFNKFAEKLPLRSIEECTVDVANGVGGVALTEVASKLKDKLSVTIRNNGDGVLNEGCGADFVITNQKAPFELEKNKCYCSLDGDADRIVFYSCDAEDSFLLLDGDRITCLLVHTIQNLMLKTELSDRFHITAVQTAYANGASTDYLQKTLKVKVLCTSTGVKHLHRAAEESSDIGVYFESNGHGTVIFSRAFKDFIQQNEKTSPDFELLQLLIDMTNSAIGDALTDLLLVVSCLNYLEWGLKEWSGIYQEWLSKLTKAKVKDRYLLKVTNADRTIVEPEGMQSELNKLIESVNERSSKPEVKARCFIRPSGTEDIVRIYAEASSESDLNEIIIGAENLIMKYLE
ncbi:phosphoacetylglucosamine mutase-like isoform X2 [Symsagittifera roscoffensis]|uniref:phosphoacetylglucosamine mutase-like isoform X2 n=1 Tax=Symsagittifera roscoffensis TaxID=84072 RepID=UPI00307C735A